MLVHDRVDGEVLGPGLDRDGSRAVLLADVLVQGLQHLGSAAPRTRKRSTGTPAVPGTRMSDDLGPDGLHPLLSTRWSPTAFDPGRPPPATA